jgi:hypothetical protein
MRTPILLLSVLGLGACSAMDPDPNLYRIDSCGQLGRAMERMARKEVLWDYRWSPGDVLYGCAEYAYYENDGGMSDGPGSYSETNVQEEGVDEADLVKTDGQYLYSLADGHLMISLAWPYTEAEELSRTPLDGRPEGIYLYGDTVVALSRVQERSAPRSGIGMAIDDRTPRTLVTILNVSNPHDPDVIRETYVEGRLEATRRIANRLFVVTYQDLRVTDGASSVRAARKLLRQTQPADWLSWAADHKRVDGAWQLSEDAVCDCTDVWVSDREGGTYLTTVMSLDLDDPLSSFAGESVIGEAETVYASTNAFYIAATEYTLGPFPSIDSSLDTILHKFDIGADDPHPSYAASTKVSGTLSDQFALSEHDGVLRVATTQQAWPVSAEVHTLREQGGAFELLDSLVGLAEGEEIFAARFLGRLGYLVTYEVWLGDPLFTIDLSDPSDIREAGSLEVTGFSTYLHPMGENHLLSVGMDETEDWDWKLAVSLFDISDMSAPALADRVLLDAAESEALDEHHAFNYFADQDALAIPSWADSGEPVLEILDARASGLSHSGQLSQQQVLESFDAQAWTCAPVRRSVIMDRYAYAVGSAGFTVATLDAPDEVLAAVPFEGLDPCSDYSWEDPDEWWDTGW